MTYYGYSDGSGEYYIVIDDAKCSGCDACVKLCPNRALQLETVFIDLEDKTVAVVKEEHRKKIKYTCAPCKPENDNTPCVLACQSGAIKCVWKPR